MEETGVSLEGIVPTLIDVELKHFPPGGQFDGVLNIFYLLEFAHKFTPQLEEWVYEEYKRCSKEVLESLPVTEHTNKTILRSVFQ